MYSSTAFCCNKKLCFQVSLILGLIKKETRITFLFHLEIGIDGNIIEEI
jgi:hypothetical protein